MLRTFQDDIRCILERDPAARSAWEVVLCYPGFHALVLHRVAHGAWQRGWRLLGRWLSHLNRWLTGIEIHPGARIGRRVFIDHGMGVVIGEMTEIHDNVTIYQGVTLGGTSLVKGAKRHPTLESGVIVGANACVLGGFTVGADARVGSGAVVTKPVPPGATVVGNPGRIIERDAAQADTARADTAPSAPAPAPSAAPAAQAGVQAPSEGFSAYGVSNGDDPLTVAVHRLADQTQLQEHQIALLWQAMQSLRQPAASDSAPCSPLPDEALTHECFRSQDIRKLLD
ncbi:serine O-acetyltransferase [Amphibiibacter pelophylacis]|uniref:Serine O-acetyltransferase n=1 Tax=Amphibiibacter pelophylacis TaxID=1799477 RepID=A0ACC6NZJ8_9BURK